MPLPSIFRSGKVSGFGGKAQSIGSAGGQIARGRYPVGNPILRGITDIAAAALPGSQRMVIEFFDHPQQLEQVLVRCTQIYQGVLEALVRTFGLSHDGQSIPELIPSLRGRLDHKALLNCGQISPGILNCL